MGTFGLKMENLFLWANNDFSIERKDYGERVVYYLYDEKYAKKVSTNGYGRITSLYSIEKKYFQIAKPASDIFKISFKNPFCGDRRKYSSTHGADIRIFADKRPFVFFFYFPDNDIIYIYLKGSGSSSRNLFYCGYMINQQKNLYPKNLMLTRPIDTDIENLEKRFVS